MNQYQNYNIVYKKKFEYSGKSLFIAALDNVKLASCKKQGALCRLESTDYKEIIS